MKLRAIHRLVRNALCLSALAFSLSGCFFLPPVVSLASLALDVGSYAVSGKTMTDHGISLVADEDCALVRVFEGQLCEENQQYEFESVATLQPLPSDEPSLLFAALPVDAENAVPQPNDPLVVLPLGYDESVLAADNGDGRFGRNPIVEEDPRDGGLLGVQFARVPADLMLTRDMH